MYKKKKTLPIDHVIIRGYVLFVNKLIWIKSEISHS